ncbi:hypothetical protein BDB00DRAFT_822496 [Zychaea mexicana]|uniref:uncharacterized protein n=1 Tax=Zychaea mexicana TaxID=64656 RepID=UPI0022FEC8D5|nr:uncharacterized protein BDB00DRAFT_822496 [Zychaea mexicana]KAI9493556.1 hypothetical protein BDB00DRAFT_822496 [Zychaea mexicana]
MKMCAVIATDCLADGRMCSEVLIPRAWYNSWYSSFFVLFFFFSKKSSAPELFSRRRWSDEVGQQIYFSLITTNSNLCLILSYVEYDRISE